MSTKVTSKGQVTIPKHIRDALRLRPGSAVDFAVDGQGQVVLVPAKAAASRSVKDRFESVRGSATVKWRTEDLMRMLRDDG
jgi:antitoxin PrlF